MLVTYFLSGCEALETMPGLFSQKSSPSVLALHRDGGHDALSPGEAREAQGRRLSPRAGRREGCSFSCLPGTLLGLPGLP